MNYGQFRREVIKACKAAGYRHEVSKKHHKLFPPEGGPPLIMSKGLGSTSGRAMENIKADLRRRGIEL